jgi:polysaccharide export outer membrane protein
MKPAVLLACLIAVSVAGCSWIPRAGPSVSEVVEQGQPGGEILFDVVEVDDRVVSTLLAQPKESFRARFKKNTEPADFKIAVGDTISVLIWESAAGGLFSEASPASRSTTTTEPLAPEIERRIGPRASERNLLREAPRIGANVEASGRSPATIPDQLVEADGAISVPYADRIPAAGRSPAEVQQTIEERLAQKALEPQALVIVKKSAANSVTVTGEAGVAGAATTARAAIAAGGAAGGVAVPLSPGGDREAAAASGFGARVPLSPGGDRLLEVVAAAGGAKAPVDETFVRLSRDGVTATIPFEQLVADPAENIYARPGDVLTLVQVPQTFSVFGATGRNAKIAFDAQKITLSDALGKSQGLRDDLAKPDGVFLFRYEPNSVVRALDQPIATGARTDVSPIVYRFNLRDGEAYFLARKFPVHDRDVIFVADAPAAQTYKFFGALNQVTGPILTGLLTCSHANC